MPCQPISPGTVGAGTGGVAAQVGPALLFSHSHADQSTLLLRERQIARIVFGAQQRGQPVAGQVRIARQGGDRAVGHGGRAHRPGLDLGLQDESCRPRHMRPGLRPRPGSAMQPAPGDAGHQRMPRRVKLDLVAPEAAGVECLQLGRMRIREAPLIETLRRAQFCALRHELRLGPAPAVMSQRLAQCRVGQVQVVAAERRRLIRHRVRLPSHVGLLMRCGKPPSRHCSTDAPAAQAPDRYHGGIPWLQRPCRRGAHQIRPAARRRRLPTQYGVFRSRFLPDCIVRASRPDLADGGAARRALAGHAGLA
ncbi:hypothetical protein GALL_451310 [mine drainage metagenome]|uniref:Uncharacterized protein n=1 Tax=mine drainage metagenome TaxID=410659 RepID=A0A1J5Q6Y5_9ZZZZ